VRRSVAFVALLFGAVAALLPSASEPRFYPDDPISREPESRSAKGAKPLDISLFYEYTYNLFVTAKRLPSNTRAGNINTIDEVPDSSWFTNRVGVEPVTPEQVARGANSEAPPASERWVVFRAKTAGTNPGYTARDASGRTWFLHFDSQDFPEGESGAIEVMTRLFWALGYNQVQTFITTIDPARVQIEPQLRIQRPSGEATPATRDDIKRELERAARNADGTYRVSASLQVPGKILGSFRYAGTRSDDPNDLVPHEHRRELRALRVFGAWTNLVDWKGGNTLDALVEQDGRSIVKHYLQDVGSSLGMANEQRHEWQMGWEYLYDPSASWRRLWSFGFALSPWQTVPYDTSYSSIGLLEGDRFDPTAWRPQTPLPPYIEMRPDDAFWAARRVMAFNDDLIRAAVHEGRYSDPAAERHLVSVLVKRRDAIGRTYLPAVNPIVSPRLDGDGTLSFDNAAVAAGFAEAPMEYRAAWSRFDNATGQTTLIGETIGVSTTLPKPGVLPVAAGSFVEIDISAESAAHPSWRQPIRTHFRRDRVGWKLVGLERMPDSPVGHGVGATEAKR
jgi:hypothetical protein